MDCAVLSSIVGRSIIVVTAIALASGCRPPPPEVPADLGKTAEALFRTFDTEPENLAFLVEAAEDQMGAFDLAGDIEGRKFQLTPLDPAGLDITFPEGEDPARQTPILVVGESRHGFDDSISPSLQDNQICIESDTTVAYRRTWLEGSAACVADASCDVARTTNAVRKELSFIAAGWYDLKKDLRRVTLSDDRDALVVRGWAEQAYCGDRGNNRFAQTYTLELWIADGDTTKRLYAGWLEIDIGLPPDGMKNLIADSFDEGFVFGDNFVDTDPADYCPRDRDAVIEGEPGDNCPV